MSYESAVGQVDQILKWQQQVLNPAAAGATTTTGSGSTTSTANTAFAAALAEAQGSAADEATGMTNSSTDLSSLLSGGDSQLISSLLNTGGSSTTGTATVGSSSAADSKVSAMVAKADSLLGKPYVWGGGHGSWGPQTGYDCSGFVSAVLHAGGYLNEPQDTETLPNAAGIEPGPGQYVTIYDRSGAGQDGHVIIEINGQFYESGGEHGAWGGGGGVEKIARPSASYLATFNDILHPAGL